jgi:hypothetical protein
MAIKGAEQEEKEGALNQPVPGIRTIALPGQPKKHFLE